MASIGDGPLGPPSPVPPPPNPLSAGPVPPEASKPPISLPPVPVLPTIVPPLPPDAVTPPAPLDEAPPPSPDEPAARSGAAGVPLLQPSATSRSTSAARRTFSVLIVERVVRAASGGP